MNYKKIMLVALVLLTIITLSAVSAADDVNALTIADEGDDGTDIVEASPSDEILTDSGDDIPVGDGNTTWNDYDPDVEEPIGCFVQITYCPEDIVIYDEGRVYYDVPLDHPGTAALIIDGKEIESKTVDDSGQFKIDATGLSLGEHALSVKYTNKLQEVASDSAKFNVVAAKIYVPDKMNINGMAVSANMISVELNRRASGTLAILIDNKEYLKKNIDANVDDIYYIYGLADVSRGKHDVAVIYNDNNLGTVSENKTVDFGYEIWYDFEGASYGEDTIINAHIPNNLGNGDLTMTLDGNKVSWTKKSNILSTSPSKLSYGNHTVAVKYSGDDFYPAQEFAYTFEIVSEIIVPEYVLVGTDDGISLTLPGDAKGKLNVTIKVEGEEGEWQIIDSKLVSFDNGKAHYSFADLPVSGFTVEASYTGNDYQVNSRDTDSAVTPIDWGSSYIGLGENKTITFVSWSSEPHKLGVIFSRIVDAEKEWDEPVNVVDNFDIDIVNGKATHTFTNLMVGYYHIFVAEDPIGEDVDFFQQGFYFVVEAPQIEAESGEVALGNITPMVVPLPGDANGKVTVTVLANYTKEVPTIYKTVDFPVSGKTTIDLNNVITDAGVFEVIANYTGNYGTFMDSFVYVIPVKKVASEVKIDVGSSYKAGDAFTIAITSNVPAVVTINGKAYEIKDGKVVVDTTTLPSGAYVVVANVTEDDKFLPSSDYAVFTISRIDAGLAATAKDIKEGETAVIEVSLNVKASGKVLIGDKEITISAGKGKLEIPNLPLGNYEYTVTFAGDAFFENATVKVSFSVLTDPTITAKNTKVLYTAKGKYSVTVYGTDGKVASGTEVIFTIAGKQVAKATTDANGVATYTVTKTPGTYKITAAALGVNVTKTLTVKHLVTLKSVTVKKSAKKLVLQATLSKVNGKYLKNKQVTFKFNGKTYKAKTNSKGVAKYTLKSSVLKKLKVGKKVTYQATYLKDTVKKTAKVKK